MEYIVTTVTRLNCYVDYLERRIKKMINESMAREDMFKPLKNCKHILRFFTSTENKNIENICNDLYTLLRKIHINLQAYYNGSVFGNEQNMKTLKGTCDRNNIYLKEVYSEFLNKDPEKVLAEQAKIQSDTPKPVATKPKKFNPFLPKHLINKKPKGPPDSFLLKFDHYKDMPKLPENLFANLVQFKDEVYYIKIDDVFNYFYFYRTAGGTWYWSPPKKNDPEDIWIQVPQTQIVEGHWKYMKIPNYIEEFVEWLDLFVPEIPEFYKKNDEQKEAHIEQNVEKLASKFDKLEGKDCIIF